MKIFTHTSTQARNNFFDLMNAAKYAGQTTIITKNGKPVAKITPITNNQENINWNDFEIFLKDIKNTWDGPTAQNLRQETNKNLADNLDKKWK